MGKRLSGLNPLSYEGVEPLSPPLTIEVKRAPKITDRNYNIGTFWIEKNTQNIYILVNKDNGVAIWAQLGSGGAGATQFNADIGFAIPVANSLNFFGDITTVFTTGANNTITVNLIGNFTDEYIANIGTAVPAAGVINILGGTQFTTSGAGNTVTTDLLNGANGQILIGGGAAPVWANITSLGGTITITNGPNSINLETVATPASQAYLADVGVAVPAAGILNVFGGSNLTTVASVNTIRTNLDDNVSISGSWNAGTTVTAGTGLIVSNGGIDSTGTTTLHSLGAGAMQTTSNGTVFSDNGTDGQVLIGGNLAPAWRNITSLGGSITVTNTPNHINLDTSGGIAGDPFLAYQAVDYNNSFGSEYFLGSASVLGEVFDVGNNFFPGDGVGTPASFTAPATGKYFFSFVGQLFVVSMSANIGFTIILRIRTTTRNYIKQDRFGQFIATTLSRADRLNNFETIALLNAGDTAQFTLQVVLSSGAANFNLVGSGPATIKTCISGYRFL